MVQNNLLKPFNIDDNQLLEDTSVCSMLARAVEEGPTTVSVIDSEGNWTFADLWNASARVWEELESKALSKGGSVALILDPGFTMIAAIWGVLRGGWSYQLISGEHPAERIRYQLEDSQAEVVLTSANKKRDVEAMLPGSIDVMLWEIEGTKSTQKKGWIPQRQGDDAYIIHTSGTTGRPKGVRIDHYALTNQLVWLNTSLDLGDRDRILAKSPVTFDAAQWELLANALGATVVIPPAGSYRDPQAVCDWVREHGVTVLQCVPTFWAAFVRTQLLSECSSLRLMCSGGEALTSHLAGELLSSLPEARLINLYGPTEVTINATWFDVQKDELSRWDVVPIGVPVDGCTALVLDERARECIPGQVGELYLGGRQLSPGYLNRPEHTKERFPTHVVDGEAQRLYRTGDLVIKNEEGVLEFRGRVDDQVKINGYRVETVEIQTVLENHPWVQRAAVIPYSLEGGRDALAAFVTLDPDQAPLMDQDLAGSHHISKGSHHQVKAQLADLGSLQETQLRGPDVVLPGAAASAELREAVFRRKTYRFYEGEGITYADIIGLLSSLACSCSAERDAQDMTLETLGGALRWFGPFDSPERLLAKYAYASPGALNGTRLYLDLVGLKDVSDGHYYFHPRRHALWRLSDPLTTEYGIRIHFVGVPSVIESVYKINVNEVLSLEIGHMTGLLDRVWSRLGYTPVQFEAGLTPFFSDEDPSSVVSFRLEQGTQDVNPFQDMEVLIQVHGAVEGLRRGTYRWQAGGLDPVTGQVVERRQVVAINQQTYDRSSVGVGLRVPRPRGRQGLVQLGRAMHHLQDNGLHLGFMSSGYSSLSGRDLPAALRLDEIAPTERPQVSYFAIGGKVSLSQELSQGMAEDMVHSRGPLEILRDDLKVTLPHYMVPSKIEVIDKMPTGTSGKIDRSRLLAEFEKLRGSENEAIVPPSTDLEVSIHKCWEEILGQAIENIDADFFALGGDSLQAVQLAHHVNAVHDTDLPVQAVFETPSIRAMAQALANSRSGDGKRLVKLVSGSDDVIVMWPGLGGYPLNLRELAQKISHGRTVYGMQAPGLNLGEVFPDSLKSMAESDLKILESLSDSDSMAFIGYSFGARIAAEVAGLYGARNGVDPMLILLAPGSPVVEGAPDRTGAPEWDDPYFCAVLESVFLGRLPKSPFITARHGGEFANYITEKNPSMPYDLVMRIVQLVHATFDMRRENADHLGRVLQHSFVLDSAGDGWSFVDDSAVSGMDRSITLNADHYEILREPSVRETAKHVIRILQGGEDLN